MAGYIVEDTRKVTTVRLAEMKRQGKRIAMLTSYDYSMAQIVDQAGVDVILIGDSAGNVMAGNQTTIPVTLDEMIYHGRCVARAVKRALVVCDMPFGTYHASRQAALGSLLHFSLAERPVCVHVLCHFAAYLPVVAASD